MQCKKCVLPEHKPDIWLNENGICNICSDFEKKQDVKQEFILHETELTRILNKYRGKNKYDCLVMCSGGKDSTLSLYYMKRRYKMNPLAFTFDNGFENNEALENIKNAVNILGIDWLYYKSDFMKEIYAKMVKTKTPAPICHVCAIWYMQLTHDVVRRYQIPLLVAGWTKGQSMEKGESGREYTTMSKATADFVVNYLHKEPKYKEFPESISRVIRSADRKFKTITISPHWFLQWDPERIKDVLQKELKWKAPALSYPAGSTNCLMNFVSVYLSLKYYGYTHYHVEISKLIRGGEMSREEALRMLAINFDDKLLKEILRQIGCELEDCPE